VDDLYGMQPMRVNKLPHLYLIYNGEIYNHKMVEEKYNFDVMTKCDGEVILHLYDKFGAEKAAQMLDGVFAFCIVDTKKKQVHLGRDTFGVRPMFTLTKKGTKKAALVLCSEIKSLVPIEQQHTTANGHKMELEVFPPGEYASYSLGPTGLLTLIEKGPYTYVGKKPVFDTRVKPDSSDHLENIRTLFTEAVKKRLMADRRIGCLLSGGLDSSLVAALLTKLAKEAGMDYPIQTFSIGMEGSTDVLAARKVAAHIGRHPLHGMYLISKYISKETDTIVLYSGDGSDELCQGYIHFHKAPSADEGAKESRRLLKDLYTYDVLRSDRLTAVHGLEVRVPFLDVDFTSYFLSLPAELRQPQKGIEKWLVRSAFDEMDLLPKDILWRPKECFVDGIASNEPGKSWYEIIQKFASSQVPDEALAEAERLYPFNTPPTKEAFYYRQIFEEFFSGHEKLVPYFWMPRWIEATDPSARTLSHYK
ncbi:hypothetical protein QZH41_008697, partial [Actinostola sp. cb2023]